MTESYRQRIERLLKTYGDTNEVKVEDDEQGDDDESEP